MTPQLLDECTAGAFAGTMTFGETIGHMQADGVEWYSANLILGMKTHYAADLSHRQTRWPNYTPAPIANAFSSERVAAAIEATQRREIVYPEFLRQIAAAGTVYTPCTCEGAKPSTSVGTESSMLNHFPTAKPGQAASTLLSDGPQPSTV